MQNKLPKWKCPCFLKCVVLLEIFLLVHYFVVSSTTFLIFNSVSFNDRYAREDTHYLLYIYDLMKMKLSSMPRESEESDFPLVEVQFRLASYAIFLMNSWSESTGFYGKVVNLCSASCSLFVLLILIYLHVCTTNCRFSLKLLSTEVLNNVHVFNGFIRTGSELAT